METQKSIRDAIMGARVTKERIKIVTKNMGDKEIEIEEPGIADMGVIYRKQNLEDVVIALLVEHSFVPGTNDKVFNSNDALYLKANLKMKYPWVKSIFIKAKEWAGEEDQVKKLLSFLKKTQQSTMDTQSVSNSAQELQEDPE